MANPFKKFKTEGVESSGDFVGGRTLLETDIYEAEVLFAYLGSAANSEASSVNLILRVDNGSPKGFELRAQEWVSNRKGEAFYVKDDKKRFLPGYETINDLTLLTVGKTLEDEDLEVDERIAKIWNNDTRKEENKAVDCFVDLHGEKILVAIQKVKEDKTKKNDSTGEYEPTGEFVENNKIVKFLDPETRRTKTEIENELEEAVFADTWLEKNKGVTRDATKGTSNKGTGTGLPTKSDTPKSTNSIFNKNKNK